MSTLLARANLIPASIIDGATAHSSVIFLDVRGILISGSVADKLVELVGVRIFLHDEAAYETPVTTYKALEIKTPDVAVTIANEYGVYIPNLTTGTNVYGIFTEAFSAGYPLYITGGTGTVYLGPNTGIGGSYALSPSHPLIVSSQNAGTITLQIKGQANKEVLEVATFTSAPVPTVRGRGSRGTVASPTATQSGDTLLRLAGTGTDNAGTPAQTGVVAAIDFAANQNFTTAAQGTVLYVKLCPDSSTSLTTYATFGQGTTTLSGATTITLQLDSSGDTNEYLKLTRTSSSGQATCTNDVLTPSTSYSVLSDGAPGTYIELGSLFTDTDGVCISIWIRPEEVGLQRYWVVRGQDGSGNGWGWGLYQQSDNKINFSVINTSPAQINCVSTTTVSSGTWYHVMAIWFPHASSGYSKLYINGTLETTTAHNTTQCRSSGVGLRLFRNYDGGEGVNGYMDALQFWKNTVIDATEAAALAAGTDPTTTPNYQYKMNEGSGTTIANTGSGGSANGTFNGGISWSTIIPAQNPLPATGSTGSVNIFVSADGTIAGEVGVTTFGHSTGTTQIRGNYIKVIDGPLRYESRAAPSSPTAGDTWYDSTQKTLAAYTEGLTLFNNGYLFVQTASATVANTTTQTTVTSTGKGTRTLPANFMVAGRSFHLHARGYLSTDAVPGTLRIRVKLGSTVIADTTAKTPGGGLTNQGLEVDVEWTCRTTGASGTVMAQGNSHYHTGTVGSEEFDMVNTAATTIDTTVSQTIDVTVEWSTASANNSLTITNLTIEALM